MACGVDTAVTQNINILLLGETGVGKSTFINAFVNYLQYEDFATALHHEPTLLIPVRIAVTDADYNEHVFTEGEDIDEVLEAGAAASQRVKSYDFPIPQKNIILKIIDSPGMGDPRGFKKDNDNCENILTYLSQIKELHGICFLMKPAATRNTVFFEYCLEQILSRLDTSACNNIIFIFTNTRGTYYKPAASSGILKEFFKKVEKKSSRQIKIPYGQKNVFCLDNEGFVFWLAARKGLKLDHDVIEGASQSWLTSARECRRLFSYVFGEDSQYPLTPHQLATTSSVNRARKLIFQLSQPTADVSQLIDDNLRMLQKHTNDLSMENQSMEQLKQKLYVPTVDIEQEPLEKASTICMSRSCSEVVSVNGINKWHYSQICCQSCLSEYWGFGLFGCAAFGLFSDECKVCSCNKSDHKHLYYLTKIVHGKKIDEKIRSKLTDKESFRKAIQAIIEEMNEKQKELQEEREIIIECTAKFHVFLKKHAISPCSDAFKGYIEYLIHQEESLDSRERDSERIRNFRVLLDMYEVIKNRMETDQNLDITAEDINNLVDQLCNLTHTGSKIKELFEQEETLRAKEQNGKSKYVFVNIINNLFKGKKWNE